MNTTSKACLTYKRGMNIYCEASHEFTIDGLWYRVEAYRESPKEELKAAAYKKHGCYWIKHWSLRLSMEKRLLLEQLTIFKGVT